MGKDNIDMEDGKKLRREAERSPDLAGGAAEDLTGMSPQAIANLVHELRVHQIELKMQNDELRRIQAELEKARDRYVHLYDFAPTGYFTVTVNGAVAEANLTAATLLERPRAELFGRMFSSFIHRADQGAWYFNRKRLLETGELQSFQLRLVKHDGDVFDVNLECLLVEDRQSGHKHIRIAATDITGLKRAESGLRLALEESRQINEELSQYAYAVTHDLKAPLRAVSNYADFLHEDLADSLTGEQKQYLTGMKKALTHGDDMIGDLLNFARIGHLSLEVESIDVRGLVAEIIARLVLPPDFKIEVPSQWPAVSADRSLLEQILQNLIINGIKFNRQNPKRIEIGWQPAPDDRIEIFVRDNGIGIESRYHEHIFRIFRRLHTNSEYEGTGIGLSIVQKAARKLGGDVRMESRPGDGSTFYVNLPKSK